MPCGFERWLARSPEAAAGRDVDQGAGEAATPVGGAACSPRGHRGGYLYRPYFLKIATQSFARLFCASSAVPLPPTTKGCQRLLAAVSNSAYSGTAQKSFTMNIDW